MDDFKKGDIVINIFTSEANPYHKLLYIGKGICRQGRYTQKVYDCIGFDGGKVQLMRDPDGIKKVGHMDEFDSFIYALKALKAVE